MPTRVNRTSSDDAITDSILIEEAPQIKLSLLLREIRRERTGVHALAAVVEGGRVLTHDTFNIGRREDRARLCKDASKALTNTSDAYVTPEELAHMFDVLCLYAQTEWETDKVQILEVNANVSPPGRTMLLYPHIEQGTGTIIYAPPGSGKSYLMDLMAISLTSGLRTLWDNPRKTPCLYVDLERNQVSFQRRLSQIRQAIGVDFPLIPYVRGRGMGLSNLKRKLREWVRDHPGAVLLYDSISRMGNGSLVEDDTANQMIDLANGCSDTWVALAHSPRADASHAFGSMMFDAGADMMIKMSSEHRADKLGCALTVTKANHTGSVPILTFELTFNENGLKGFASVKQSDWPELVPDMMGLIVAWLATKDMTATELETETKFKRPTIIAAMEKDARFERKPRAGKEVYWGLSGK